MRIELKHDILNDKFTQYVYDVYDIQNKEQSISVIEAKLQGIPQDWNIGVIYGGSGSGKTTILKNYFKKEIDKAEFDGQKSLISNFDWLEPEEAAILLSSMGLSSIPAWLRPYHTLSNGEQYRARLAYIVGKANENDVILIDEYTSVVDRDVAKAMSNALNKYIRRTNKKIVLASCHFDIMVWLDPDWIYSPQKRRLEIAPCRRQRPRIHLEIFRARYEAWNLFKQHHYLTEDMHIGAKCFVVTQNDKPVAFIGILAMPSGNLTDAWRVSRLVVLPDYQGLGIGMKLLNIMGSMYVKDNKKLYIKTSNATLFVGMSRNEHNWKLVNEENNIDKIKEANKKYTEAIEKGDAVSYGGLGWIKESITKSYKYIGQEHEGNIDVLTFNADAWKNVAQNQQSLF
jgi:ABC-type lipoprotein export system ATPase subunit/GNAT superfamily N-acetyltransferase